VKKKVDIGKSIESDILKVLKESENPVSTREICLRIKRAWHSVNNHCLKLQLKGLVECFTIGKSTAWRLKK